MKEEIQAKIYEEIKDMSSTEIMAYFNKKAQGSALWQRLTNRDKLKSQTQDFWDTNQLDAAKMEEMMYGHNRREAK